MQKRMRCSRVVVALAVVASSFSLPAEASAQSGDSTGHAPPPEEPTELVPDQGSTGGDEQVDIEIGSPTRPISDILDAELNALVAEYLDSHLALTQWKSGALGAGARGRSVDPRPPSVRDQQVRVLIWAEPSSVASVQRFLQANGADSLRPRADTAILVSWVPVSLLLRLSRQAGVIRIEVEPRSVAAQDGATAHGATRWQNSAFGANGEGVRIAVIDAGFAGYSPHIGTELPSPAGVYCYLSGSEDVVTTIAECETDSGTDKHGTQVTEYAYDVAPDASYYLVRVAYASQLHGAMDWLAENEVDVINMSIQCLCWDGPGDGSYFHPLTWMSFVDRAAAQDITVVISAGNTAGRSWFARGYNDPDADGWLDWDDGDECNTFSFNEGDIRTALVRWDDVWRRATRDLDVYVTHSDSFEVVAKGERVQNGGLFHLPMEAFRFEVPTTGSYCLAVKAKGGAAPGWVQAYVTKAALEHDNPATSLVSMSETKSPGTLVVGAAPWNDTDTIERFSSQGPTIDGRIKPDLVGADGVASQIEGGNDLLFGTSFAAPHVAGLAALVKQRNPWFTATEIAGYLKDNALSRGDTSPNSTWGHGFANLPGAPAVGTATIGGDSPVVGTALQARLTGHTEPDSPAGASSYQWLRVTELGTTALASAVGASYTPVASDVGAKLRVKVSYTDSVSSEEEFLSATTNEVQAQPTTLVSSIAQSSTSTEVDLQAGTRVAQRFSTGTQGSVDLKQVELDVAAALSSGSTYTVKLHGANTSNADEPGAAIVVLDGTLTATGTRTFTPLNATVLSASTTYWIVVEVTAVSGTPTDHGRLAYKTGANSLTLTTGWTLPQSSLRRAQSATSWTTVNERIGLAVKGLVRPSAPKFSANLYPGDTVTRSVTENSTGGDVGLPIAALGADGATPAYSVTATSDGDGGTHLADFNRDFALDSATGQISVRPGAAINFEARSAYKVIFQVSDGKDSSGNTETTPTADDTLTLTVQVRNVNERGQVRIRGEISPIGQTLTASVVDPDGGVTGVVWQWERSNQRSQGYVDIPSATSATYTTTTADSQRFVRARADYTDASGGRHAEYGFFSLPVAVAEESFVSNLSLAENEPTDGIENEGLAFQGFVTGSNPAGYALTKVGVIGVEASASHAVEIWTSTGDSATTYEPGRRLYGLIRPSSVPAANVAATYPAYIEAMLDPNTVYYVAYLNFPKVAYDEASVTVAYDRTPAAGWSLLNGSAKWDPDAGNGGAYVSSDKRLPIEVKGAPLVGTPSEARSLAATAGAEAVELAWDSPEFDRGRTVSKYQVRHKKRAEAEWEYSQWSDVADGPDDGTDEDDERSTRVSGLTVDVEYTFQVRAVSELGNGDPAEISVETDHSDPTFPADTASRTVEENTVSGDLGAALAATELDGDTLTYSVAATSETDGAAHLADFNRDFELDAATGQVSVKASASIDFEARPSYKVVVQVNDGEDSNGDAETGTATVDDTIELTVTVTDADDDGEVAIAGTAHVDATLTASLDDDDDPVSSVSWQWARGDSADGSFTDISTATSTTYTLVADDLGKFLRATATYTDAFEAGKTAAAVTAEVVANPHTVPVFSAETASLSVAENTTSGDVGDAVSATDDDGDGLTYSVVATSESDSAANLTAFNRDFEVGAATGQVSVKSGAQIDYETRSSYKVLLQVTDGEDNLGGDESPATVDDTITLTITVTNADDAGTVSISGTVHVDATLTASVTDLDGMVSSVTWKWARGDSADGSFTDISTATSSAYTLVADDLNKYLRATATYTDPQGSNKTAVATTAKVAANPHTVPAFSAETASRSVAENTTSGDVGDAITATDTDRDTLTYSVTATSETDATANLDDFNRDFALSSATGQITVKSGAQIDYETRSTYKVVIEVTDGEGVLGGTESGTPTVDDTITLTITVTDADDAGTVSITGTAHVDATLSASVTDPDGTVSSVTWKWARGDTANGPFTDISTATSATYTLVADDLDKFLRATASYTDPLGSGRTAAGTTARVVANPNTRPEFASDAAARTVAENTTSGNVGAPITASDSDSDTLAYSVAAASETDGAANLTDFNRDFALSSATGQITVKSGAQIDFETRSTYKVLLEVTDGEDKLGATETGDATIDDTLTLTITVTNADEAGTVTITGTTHVDATLSATVADPDGTASSVTWKWARADTANGAYTDIATATSSTYTLVAADLNKYLRATATYTDPLGSGKTAAATTAQVVANPNTVPAFSSDAATRTVAENTASGNVGDAITATDADNDTRTYSVAATSDADAATNLTAFNRDFSLNATTGQVSVNAGAQIDYETRSSYKVVIEVTDSEDNLGGAESPATVDDTITLTITVTNVDEAGTVAITGTAHVDATLTASVADPDEMVSSVSWKWARGDSADGLFTDISTATSATYTLVADDLNKFLRATATYTDALASNKSASATAAKVVANPNIVPEFGSDTAARTVAENTTSGNVGAAVTATDTNGDTLTYSVAATSDSDAADNLTAFNRDFALNSATGQITVKAGAQIDYETRTTYKVLIRVTDSEDKLGNTESGTPTVDDTITLTITVTDADDPGTVTITGTAHVDATLSASVTDPDGTASSVTWKWARGDTANGAFTDIATATSSTYTVVADDLNKFLRATASYTDPLGSGRTAAAKTAKVVANPHTVPEFDAATATRTVAENSTSGNVGDAITATDGDSDTLAYSVAATSETDAATDLAAFNRDFALNATTGQVTVKAGAAIDFETRTSYKVLIRVTDSEDNLGNTETGTPTVDDTITLTITVTDADDPGTVTITGTAHVDATLSATVADPDGMVSSITWKWARADTANGPFTDITTATSATYTLVADDLDKFLRATATYTDPLDSGRTAAAVTVKVTANPNTMPAFSSDTAARSVAENTTSGNVGAAITASDTDSDTLAYSVAATSDADGAAHLTAFNRDFALSSATGQITVKSGAQIDFETRTSYKVLIEVTDSEDNLGNTESPATVDDTLTLTITVTNADDPGEVAISGTPHIDATLTASVTDPDGSVQSVSWKWARGNSASGPFTTLTGETASTYTVVAADLDKYLQVTASYTDAFGSGKTAAAVTSKVTASPYTRPAFTAETAARTVAENTTSGNVGAAITATDVDSDTLSYSVTATSEGDAAANLTAFNRDFALNATTGQITVKAGAAIDYETRSTYKVLIEVTDSEDNLGNTESGTPTVDDTITLTITVTNADDPGTVTITGTAHVDATLTASVTDPDGTASSITWKWARASTANGPFTDLPGETATTYTLVAGDLNKFLRATASYTDPLAAGKTASAVTVKVVANPNTMPAFASDTAARSIAENTTSGNVGAAITATDSDGDTRTYSVAATSETDAAANLTAFNRDFALNSTTGQVTVKSGAQIDYETRTTYKVLIEVTDSEDNLGNTETGTPTVDDSLTLTITVTDADDPGTVTITGTAHVDATLSASVTDPDGAASSITWKWARGDTANGAFTDIATATSSTYTLVADDLDKFLRATASYTDPLGSGRTAAGTTVKVVANPNTVPEFASDTAARSVAENTTSGNVGDAITASDTDSDTLAYSVAATSDADGAAHLIDFNRDFSLSSTTGQITVKAGAQIDYETRTSYKVLLQVTDSEDNLGNTESPATVDDTLTLTITVTNADDPGTAAISGIPHIDAILTASVTDPDGSVQSVSWKWARGNSASGPFTTLTGETASTYTVVAADLDKYLRATATYTDAFGAGKTAAAVTSKVTASPHTRPAFTAQTAARTVAENTTSGNVGDAITATDVDSDTLAYSVAATTETDGAANLTAFNRDFAVSSATGQITVKPGAQIDYETRSTYKVLLQVTDSEDNLGNTESGTPTVDDSLTLTITVTDADDPGTVTITGTAHVDATLSASVTDPDGMVSSVTWKWARGDSADGSFTDISTATSAAYTLVADDLGKFLRATASYTDPLAAGKTASAVTVKVVANPNTMPAFSAQTASRTVAENTTSGNVGAPITATDDDSDTLAYSVAATTEAGAAANLTAFNRDFALSATTGQITVKPGAQIDYETRTSYKVLVQVTDSEDNLGNTESGNPTIDDSLTLTVTVTDADDPGTVTITGTAHVDATLTASVTDPDGSVQSVSWKWARGNSASGPFTDLTGKTASTYTVVADDLDKFLRATASYTDPLGSGRTAAAVTVKVVANPNTMPAFSAQTASRSAAENTTSGNVGDAITATDDDSDTLAYSVAATSDADGAAHLTAFNRDFSLNATTGQVTVKSGAQIDFETRTTYKVLIEVTDSEDNLGNTESPATVDDTITLTITVTNADDPGEAAISGIPHIDATLTASVTDPDGSVQSVSWKWARGNSASGPFTDITGETASTYTVVAADLDKYLRATATYTDAFGAGKTALAITSKVTASPHTRPAFSAETAARTVAENTTSGNVGAAITATDVDNDTLAYSVAATTETDAAANLTAFNRDFALSSTTGQITVKPGAQIDYETRSAYTVLLQVTDSEDNLGNTESPATVDDTLTLTITVTDADDAGTVTISGTAHVDATVTASVTDPDGTASSITWKWARGDTANGSFTNLTGKTAAAYTVVADDLGKFLRATASYTDPLASGRTAAGTTARVVANPNTRPEFASDTAARSVAENRTSGNVGAVITATDSDGDTRTYSVAATSETDAADNLTAFNRDFSLNAMTGQVTVKPGAQIDFETRTTYKVLVEVTDGEDNLGNTETGTPTVDDTITLTITVTDADDAGTVAIAGTAHVDATLTASVTDPDGTASSITWKWARGDSANGSFTDISTATSATYTVVADDLDKYLRATATYTDPLGSGRTAAAVTVKVVANPNTVPAFSSDTAARSVAENTTSGSVGAAITASDDDNDTLAYSVAATSETDATANLAAFNRDFALSSTTGQITVKSGAQIDFETRSTYKVLIEVTDSEDVLGNTESPATVDDTLTLTITVTNADDPGTAAISGIPHIDATLTASVTDPDGSVQSVTWTWARGNSASGPFTTLTGETASTYTVVAADLDKYLRATATYTDALGSNKTAAAVTSKVTASPHTRPAFADTTAARTVAENTTSGNVGAAITATDVDNDTLAYSVTATSEADAAANLTAFNRDFALSSTTGQIRVKAGAQIDYETRSAYKVLIEVTDSEDSLGNTETGTPTVDDTLTLTITVTNADEAGTVTISGTAYVDATLSASVTDPDGMVSSITWKWARASTSNGAYTDISTATSATYTVVADDLNKFLRATASYSDAVGSGKTASAATARVTANPHTRPAFSAQTASRTIAENTTSGNLGAAITATESDGDTLTYSVAATSETDAAANLAAFNRDFALNSATGQITVMAGAHIDYETRSSYKVVIEVTDGEDSLGNTESGNPTVDDTLTLTITVTNIDDRGELTVDGEVAAGLPLAVVLFDRDGGVSGERWQWAWSTSETGEFTDIPAADGGDQQTYMPREADVGRWLRATVRYTDAEGADKQVSTVIRSPVLAVPAPPEDRALWRRVSFARDRETAYYSLPGLDHRVSVAEGDSVTVLVRLDGTQVLRPYSVPITVEHGGGASGDDYRISPASVSFQPGALFASFTVEAVADGVDDDNEYLILGLEVPDGLRAGHVTSLRVDLVDDPEDLPPARLSFEPAALSGDEGDWVTATVTLGAPPDEWISNWSVLARLEVSSTLENAENVRLARVDGTQLRFSAGKMTDTVRVQCGSDGVEGPGHRVTVRLAGVTAGSRSGGPHYPLDLETGPAIEHELVVDCADAHKPAELRAHMTVASGGPWYRPSESGDPATVVVALSDPADREVTIPIETVHHGSLSGDDYTGVPDEVTFAAGQQTATFEVWAVDDDADDDGEWLEIKFGALPPGVAVAGGRTWHSAADAYWDRSRYAIEIIDDDDTPVTATSGITSASASFTGTAQAVEPGGVVTVTVELHRFKPFRGTRVQQQVTVPLTYSYSGGATAADWGSGVEGADALPTALVFEPGQRYHKFRVVAVGPHTPDSPKTITITFGTLPQGVTAYTDPNHQNPITITITA